MNNRDAEPIIQWLMDNQAQLSLLSLMTMEDCMEMRAKLAIDLLTKLGRVDD